MIALGGKEHTFEFGHIEIYFTEAGLQLVVGFKQEEFLHQREPSQLDDTV